MISRNSSRNSSCSHSANPQEKLSDSSYINGSQASVAHDRDASYDSAEFMTAQSHSDSVMATSEILQGDLGSIFPERGDNRRPPEWYTRALMYAVIAVFLGIFVWYVWGSIGDVMLNVVISLFIAFAIEPVVKWLIAHGWKRGAATGMMLLALFIVTSIFISLFGNLLVQQVVSIISGLPNLYKDIATSVHNAFGYDLPKVNDLGMSLLGSIRSENLTQYASQVLSTASITLTMLLNTLTVILLTYYMSASGPSMRQVICHYLPPAGQKRFLITWTVVQQQISGFLYSRTVLAITNAICLSIFMIVLHVPNWLPLSIACGLVSQFVPTIGTYIGGALPIVFAWGTNGIREAIYIFIFITVYQQIENMILSPAISRSTMDLNPAIALLSVFVFGNVFGALGAFLALPITASVQALLSTYLKRYELVDSDLLTDPQPTKKSIFATAFQTVAEFVSKPFKASRQHNSHVTVDDLIRFRESVESIPDSRMIPVRARKSHGLQGRGDGQGHGDGQEYEQGEPSSDESLSQDDSQRSSARPIQPVQPSRHVRSSHEEGSSDSADNGER